ncbi:hypothetical protein BCR34DRAFT_624851 [Clohesyomyces aquaticus]|uniref:Uncharacterized protein n=1 Tax=Clohesyomyces aquaticus TaxID=1231657 RepID=A0A1Y1ZM58_9PLEO|nr:hypothetical protein BCR34DRAFT_624851 [Clohesyomyces aquaticus]
MSSSLHTLATSFLSAFTSLSSSQHISLRSPTCTHIFAPASLSIPPKTNSDFAAHMLRLQEILIRFPVTAKEIHVNDEKRQAVIWATGRPDFREEVRGNEEKGDEDWEYTGEYIFMLDVDGEGRIERIVEFLDSKGTERLLGMVKRARENLAARKEDSVQV